MQRERKRRFGVNAIIDQTDDGVDAETSLSLSLHFYLSSPPLHFFTFFSRSQSVILFSLNLLHCCEKGLSAPGVGFSNFETNYLFFSIISRTKRLRM